MDTSIPLKTSSDHTKDNRVLSKHAPLTLSHRAKIGGRGTTLLTWLVFRGNMQFWFKPDTHAHVLLVLPKRKNPLFSTILVFDAFLVLDHVAYKQINLDFGGASSEPRNEDPTICRAQ